MVLTPHERTFNELDRAHSGVITLTDCELWLPPLVQRTPTEALPPLLTPMGRELVRACAMRRSQTRETWCAKRLSHRTMRLAVQSGEL